MIYFAGWGNPGWSPESVFLIFIFLVLPILVIWFIMWLLGKWYSGGSNKYNLNQNNPNTQQIAIVDEQRKAEMRKKRNVVIAIMLIFIAIITYIAIKPIIDSTTYN